MNSDPLSSFLTPPSKRRKLMAVLASPPKLSDLMAAFKATQSPMSASRTQKVTEVPESREFRPTKRISYAETDTSSMQASPGSSAGEGSYQESPGEGTVDSEDEPQKKPVVIDLDIDTDEDELQSDAIIHGKTT